MKAFDNEAIKMFRSAGINPTTQQVSALGDDLAAVAEELDQTQDDESLASEAAGLLRQRIGGFQNLAGYVSCLTAQKR